MTRTAFITSAAALALGLATGASFAQQPPAPQAQQPPQQGPPQAPQPYSVGNALGMPINPTPDGAFQPMSSVEP